jgi:uncharacterized membrane protein
LLALATAAGVFWWFVLPRVLAGQPPVAVGVAGCALTAGPALLLTHGFTRRGLVPLAGVAGGLLVVAALAAGGAALARLSGLAADEESALLYAATGGAVDPFGLLLAGVLLGAAGALVDVTVGQAAAVFELHTADPAASRRALFWRGLRVGRAHLGAAVHTLVLAYAGAALPLLLLVMLYAGVLGDLWNRELVAVEALRTFAGGVGLAAAVPLTTWLACVSCRPAAA